MLLEEKKPINLPINRRVLEESEWRTHYEAWKLSSLSKLAYCRKHNLPKENFYYWCSRFKQKSLAQSTSDFMPIMAEKVKPNKPDKSDMPKEVEINLAFPNQVQMSLMLTENKLSNLIEVLSHAATVIR